MARIQQAALIQSPRDTLALRNLMSRGRSGKEVGYFGLMTQYNKKNQTYDVLWIQRLCVYEGKPDCLNQHGNTQSAFCQTYQLLLGSFFSITKN